jgi:hypothetical protein
MSSAHHSIAVELAIGGHPPTWVGVACWSVAVEDPRIARVWSSCAALLSQCAKPMSLWSTSNKIWSHAQLEFRVDRATRPRYRIRRPSLAIAVADFVLSVRDGGVNLERLVKCA